MKRIRQKILGGESPTLINVHDAIQKWRLEVNRRRRYFEKNWLRVNPYPIIQDTVTLVRRLQSQQNIKF